VVTVITPSLPERADRLSLLLADVANQTVKPAAHLIGIDWEGIGPAEMRNRLVTVADTDWVAFADDDDRLHPKHFETLLGNSTDADVVWTDCEVVGSDWHPGHSCDPQTLKDGNHIPVTTLVRREAFLGVGGFPEIDDEDWGLWLQLLQAGARFRCVHEKTWAYVFHGSNRSR